MSTGRRLAASLAAGIWLVAAMFAHGQDGATGDPNPSSIASVLEAATNLPQILALNGAQGNPADLHQSIETERLRLVEILRNDGYLTADIALDWPDPAVAAASTMQVRVTPGPRYILGTIDVVTTRPIAGEASEQLRSTAAASVGESADAAALTSLSSRVNWTLGQHGYPFARVENVEIQPEPGQESATVALRVDTGERAHFVGADFARVDPALLGLVVPLIPFTAGDLYSVDDMAELRRQLAELPEVDGARADVVPEGDGGFRLALSAKRGHELRPDTLQSNLGFGLLIAVLCILAARQALVSAGAGKATVRTLSVATAGTLLLAGCFLALRIFSFV